MLAELPFMFLIMQTYQVLITQVLHVPYLTIDVFHDETEPIVRLEGIFQLGDEGMLARLQNAVFRQGMLNLVFPDDHFFF